MRRLPRLQVPAADRAKLEERASSDTLPARVVQRARLVLLAADGTSNFEIAQQIGMHWNRVAVWRRRFAQEGISGLDDEERSGRPPVYGTEVILQLLQLVSDPPPAPLVRWTVEAASAQMTARGVPISSSQTWRICTTLDLKPWEVDGWNAARSAASWSQVTDLVGLYMVEGVHACVFATSGEAPTTPDEERRGIRGAMKTRGAVAVAFGEARPQVLELDDELEMDASWLPVRTKARQRLVETFGEFVGDVAASQPDDRVLHCIVDDPILFGGAAWTNELKARVFVSLTGNRRAWMQRVELLLDVIELDMKSAGELGSEPIAPKAASFVKSLLDTSVSFVWSSADHQSDAVVAWA